MIKINKFSFFFLIALIANFSYAGSIQSNSIDPNSLVKVKFSTLDVLSYSIVDSKDSVSKLSYENAIASMPKNALFINYLNKSGQIIGSRGLGDINTVRVYSDDYSRHQVYKLTTVLVEVNPTPYSNVDSFYIAQKTDDGYNILRSNIIKDNSREGEAVIQR